MVNKCVLALAIFFYGGIMRVSLTSSPLSNSFMVYAADNCDATSTCNNTPGLDTQINNCNQNSFCDNFADGTSNIQHNNCNIRTVCASAVEGDSNDLRSNCNVDSICGSSAAGDSNDLRSNCNVGVYMWQFCCG